MSIEFILSIIVEIIGFLIILNFILEHIKKTDKHHDEMILELNERLESGKKLEQKIDNNHLLCKVNKGCFIGVGGGGCNIIEDMSKFDNRHNFIHVNSDFQALKLKTSKHKILLGFEKKAGLGCGGKEKCGKSLIDESIKNQLYKFTKDEKLVHVVVTLGGGVGSGATPEIIEYLKTLDKEIVVFVTMPFKFEGKTRQSVAKNALSNIKSIADNVMILNNDDLIDKSKSKSLGVKETFKITSTLIYKRVADGV